MQAATATGPTGFMAGTPGWLRVQRYLMGPALGALAIKRDRSRTTGGGVVGTYARLAAAPANLGADLARGLRTT